MKKIDFKDLREQAKERFKKYTTMENLFFISELLELESDKLEYERKLDLAIKTRKESLNITYLIDLIAKDLESEEK